MLENRLTIILCFKFSSPRHNANYYLNHCFKSFNNLYNIQATNAGTPNIKAIISILILLNVFRIKNAPFNIDQINDKIAPKNSNIIFLRKLQEYFYHQNLVLLHILWLYFVFLQYQRGLTWSLYYKCRFRQRSYHL